MLQGLFYSLQIYAESNEPSWSNSRARCTRVIQNEMGLGKLHKS